METESIETLEDFGAAFEAMQAEQAGKEELEDSGVSAGTLESSADESNDESKTAPIESAERDLKQDGEIEGELPSKTQYDSLRGRLREEARAKNTLAQQNEDLRRELEEARAAVKSSPVRQPAEIGDDLAEDIKEFEKRFPSLVSIVKDESIEGDEARRILAELGADQAMIYARTVVVEKSAAAKEERLRQEFDRKRVTDHWEAVYEEVPQVAAMSEVEAGKFKTDLWDWIQDQPKATREKFEPVYRGFEGIKPKNVTELYKSFFDSAGKSSSQDRISDKAKDAEAIPSRSRGSGLPNRPIKRDLTNSADFEAAFNELAEKDNR